MSGGIKQFLHRLLVAVSVRVCQRENCVRVRHAVCATERDSPTMCVCEKEENGRVCA